ncbi:MAG TPA: ROK family protein, partial [Balneolales bacterium]|nr:ROK family protein [Balneolales bacterium]
QFFQNIHRTTGEKVYQKAQEGDPIALEIFEELGVHIGNAINMILYTYDPELVIFGGSVSGSYEYFEESMWRHIRTFAYPKSLEKFRIEVSELENGGVLGAAALYYDYEKG